MAETNPENPNNILILDGITFKTSGNIVFEEGEASYYLAESPLLEKIDGIMEHGLQTLLRKLKS